ncbi:MAG: hypothetical protein N4A45_09455 [Flavobacteriales bacterium]|jgi:hypothetical protein|nr:hypothetical protein [Flavobacteriales bacterium]
MSNKGKSHNKKWLISRLKTSGSKRRYVIDGDYSDTRNSKKNKDWENLPSYEGMGKSFKFFNSKINYGLLVRFLRGKVGNDWNEVSKEIQDRIPTDLLEYKDCVKWFVSDLIEKREDGLWDKREQKYIRLELNEPFDWKLYTSKEFYVDPETNRLTRIKDFPSNRKTKGMNNEQLRAFREKEKNMKLKKKETIKTEKKQIENKTKELLKKNKDQEN